MSKLGYRNSEPYEPPKEYPKRMQRILSYFRSTLGYTKGELATTLFISETEIDRMYGLGGEEGSIGPGSSGATHLRVVK